MMTQQQKALTRITTFEDDLLFEDDDRIITNTIIRHHAPNESAVMRMRARRDAMMDQAYESGYDYV